MKKTVLIIVASLWALLILFLFFITARIVITEITYDKTTEEKLITDFNSRLAKYKGKSYYRKPLHGEGENGNAWDFYTKAMDKLKSMSYEEEMSIPELAGIPYTGDPKELEKKVSGIIEKYKDVIDYIRKGTNQLYFTPNYNYEKEPPLYLDANKIIKTFKFLASACKVLEWQGKQDEALELYLDTMKFAQDIAYGGGLLKHLVSIVGTGVLYSGIEESFSKNVYKTEALKKFSKELETLTETTPPVTDMWEIDLLWTEATIIDSIKQKKCLEFLLDLDYIEQTLPKLFAPLLDPCPSADEVKKSNHGKYKKPE